MFMRFVRVEVKQEKIPEFRQFYKDRIVPALKETDGCLFATLVQQTVRPDDFISLTLWDSPGAAEAYEQSGLFQKLTDEAGPYLGSSVEWKVRLSDELTYEYEGEEQGPLVEAFRVKSGDRKSLPDDEPAARLYVRLVAAKVKQGKTKELEERYRDEILPALETVDGFRGGFLVEGFQRPGDWISITIWYELSGTFEELAGKVSDLLSTTHQWKMSLTSADTGDKAASDDLTVTGYHVVAGKKM
jgi:heme-degrading monooxygenase HmoA